MKICICCSKKFFSDIKKFIDQHNDCKDKILTPELNFNGIINLKIRKQIAETHHNKIISSDVVYVYNPSGFIGKGTNLEIGFGLALNKKIYALEKVNDLGIDCFIEKFLTLEDLIKLI